MQVNELIEQMKSFEIRNNTSVGIKLYVDGSGSLMEFWEEETIFSFESLQELSSFLINGKLKMIDGRSVKPIQIIK